MGRDVENKEVKRGLNYQVEQKGGCREIRVRIERGRMRRRRRGYREKKGGKENVMREEDSTPLLDYLSAEK